MVPDLDDLAARAGVELFDYQRDYLISVGQLESKQRTCLYYRTGAGKSLTAMLSIAVWGYQETVVIAPPSTHPQWEKLAQRLGMRVHLMSHAKFRMKGTKLSRSIPVVADEFHLFGGQKGQGWRKLDKLALHLDAPLILMSATPNYNDAERVYCVQHILSPHVTKGGYLQFLYENCVTEQNPFGMEPIVTGFKDYENAASFLADLPRVYYLPDTQVYDIADVPYDEHTPDELFEYGYNARDHRLIASRIERDHTVRVQGLVDTKGHIRKVVLDKVLKQITMAVGHVLIFANHSTVARALSQSLNREGLSHGLVTGKTPKPAKGEIVGAFVFEEMDLLVGTATLATGTDGMDRVCHTLIILDDTDDKALRRQLVGRILPRGDYVSAWKKEIVRFVPDSALT